MNRKAFEYYFLLYNIWYTQLIQWLKFGERFNNLHFVGKDVISIICGCQILFHNLITHQDTIYTANNYSSGDGVICLAGHKSTAMFAFAERSLNPRIFVKEYPSFATVSILKDGSGNQYESISFSEMEYLISLNSLPDFELTVWSWRTGEKLVTQRTGIEDETQILRCSRTIPTVVSQMSPHSQKFILWEIHACCKRCLLNRLEFNVDTAILPCSSAWSPDGMMIIVDTLGKVFMIEVEKRKLQYIFNWTGGPGAYNTSVVWFKAGIILAGPSGEVKYYKKVSASEWEVLWSVEPDVHVHLLAANSSKDYLVGMSEKATLMLFKLDDEGPRFINVASYGKHFLYVCFINPPGMYIATLSAIGYIDIWDVGDGSMVGQLEWKGNCLVMVSNPVQPYLTLGRDDGVVDFINVFTPDKPKILTVVSLCKREISDIQISLQGNYVVACNLKTGIFFVIESDPGVQMSVRSFIDTKVNIAKFFVIELENVLKLVALVSTRVCCPSGDKIIICSMAYNTKELIQESSIVLPGLYSEFYLNPFGKLECYGIPHRSRQFHLLHILLEKQQLQLIDARSSGHQLRKFAMNVIGNNLLTYGIDGIAILRSLETKQCLAYVMSHHRMDLGIKYAVANQLNTHLVCLGQDGSLICTYLKNPVDHIKQKSLSSAILSKELSISYTRKLTLGFTSVTGFKDAKSWMEVQEDIKIMQEAALWGKEKMQLHDEFKKIQKECVALLEKNYLNPPEEKLPISDFGLDEGTRNEKIKKNASKCKETDMYLKALIVAQDNLCESLRKRFWNILEIKDRKLKEIMGITEVENYPVFSKDVSFEEELRWIMERRELEKQMQKGDYFTPWMPSDKDFDLSISPSLAALDETQLIRQTIKSMSDIHEDVEAEEENNLLALTGSSSHQYIEMCGSHHSQFELTTYLQMHNEIILLLNVGAALRDYFNKEFNEVYSLKEREMFLVTERNARLRYILSELKNTWTVITDPVWGQEEQPERIMTVENNEVSVMPYISPSRQEILDKLAAEAEARRLAELADNFRERALIVMMDGVLEVRWEDEIKKDIPKPKCMLEKNPEDYKEEDLRIIKEYEEKVAFRMNERERYRKMLEAEFQKLSQTLKDGVLKFNGRVADLFLLKLKIEAANGQEMLKVNRCKLMTHKRLSLNLEEKRLKVEVIKQESSNVVLLEEIQQLQSWTNECRAAYDSLVAREKHLEKNFKKDFPDVSQVILEQLLKFYRRRPKMHQRAQMSVTLLNELSRCTISADRPSFLPPEYLDFLKGLDQIDNYSNSPPVINEDLWNILCRVRRLKVECELKVKCSALEVADSEQTVNVYQKKLTNEKQHVTSLHEEINITRDQLLELQHNTELQIVMKQGFVEVNTTGLISDFDDAILITREQVERVNELVRKAGNEKLTAMHRATNFHQTILVKEWEHRKLRMEIEDLQEHLHNLESMKVTRDIQMYLRRRTHGANEEKSILSLEKEISLLKESYENTIQELQGRMDDLDKKISLQSKENRKLDAKITDLNVDVNEQQLLRDLEFETRHTEAMKQRMSSIVKRSQLVSIIQKQHTEILALQTELEILRLKIYPTLKYKTLI